MVRRETDKNPCLHQFSSNKYTANYSDFPPVKEEKKRQGQEIRNACMGG